MPRTGWDALFAGLVAAGVTAVLVPLTSRVARAVGAVDEPRERGLSDRPMPRLGGLAIYAGVFAATLIWLPHAGPWKAVLIAGALITCVGALDDIYDLPPGVKLVGQTAAAYLVAHDTQARVQTFTLPLVHRVDLGDWSVPLTVLGIVVIMNAVNFPDGVDGLASGVCAIAGGSFALIAFDAGYPKAGVLAAITAGAAAGFLIHNFYPPAAFMGDRRSKLLGPLLGRHARLRGVQTSPVLPPFPPP